MRINPKKEHELVELRLDSGLANFKASLGRIILPQNHSQWPNPSFIKKANRFRQIELP
jgi:hypothetical protein